MFSLATAADTLWLQTQVGWLQLNTSCTNERAYRSKHRGTAIAGHSASLCMKKHEARQRRSLQLLYNLGAAALCLRRTTSADLACTKQRSADIDL